MIFLAPGTEAGVVANLARRLEPGGALVAGFQLMAGGPYLADYDWHAAEAGLELAGRGATWDRRPLVGGGSAPSGGPPPSPAFIRSTPPPSRRTAPCRGCVPRATPYSRGV